MATRELDQAKAEEFGGKMLGVLNDAFLALLVSAGHRTGLFEVLADLEPATSEAIASAAGLQERYVREWLGGMTVGGIVEYDPDAETYYLPPEHAASLTRAAGPDNLAFFTQYVGLIGQIEDGVVHSFAHGGGVPYSAYPRFQALQAEETAPFFDAVLVDVVVPFASGLPDRLREGIDVLDIGSGSGYAVNLLAGAFPASRFAGYDFSEEGVAAAQQDAADRGLGNVRFEQRDAATIDETERYDLVTAFDVIHDLARPRDVLARIYASLRPDGVFLMGDIAASSHLHENVQHPLGPMLYAASVFHCMTVSLAQDGEALGTVWGEQKAVELLREAGFASVGVHHIDGDPFHVYYVAQK